ncbi:unnamed protein product [Trichobilharzia regenti]|nr:unnamed protein product [Trichobilharzia regenti]
MEFIFRSITPLKADFPDMESTLTEYLFEKLKNVLSQSVKLAELLQESVKKTSEDSVDNNLWFNRVNIALTLFELLMCIAKADKDVLPVFLNENIVKLLEKFPSKHKVVRSAARRFLNFLREDARKHG